MSSPHQLQLDMNIELDRFNYQFASELLSSTPSKLNFHHFLNGNPDFQTDCYQNYHMMASPCESTYSQETDYALLELDSERESKLKLEGGLLENKLKLEEELLENFSNCATYMNLYKSQNQFVDSTNSLLNNSHAMNTPMIPSYAEVDQTGIMLPQLQTTSESPKRSRGRRASSKPDTSAGAKSFNCEYMDCGKVFKRSEHLKRHIRSIHTLEKPFQCPFPACSKRFSRSDNLNQHIRIHRHSKDKRMLHGHEGFGSFVQSSFNSGHL